MNHVANLGTLVARWYAQIGTAVNISIYRFAQTLLRIGVGVGGQERPSQRVFGRYYFQELTLWIRFTSRTRESIRVRIWLDELKAYR